MAQSNGIAARQMQEQNLHRLAAQRELYAEGKWIGGVQLVLSVLVIVAITVLALLLKSHRLMGALGHKPIDVSWIVTISGILITIIDVFLLARLVDKFREQAAKIQEIFDCEVLRLPFNTITVGEKPTPEEVYQNAQKFLRKHKLANIKGCDDLKDWYCVQVDAIPLAAARIICQRSNIRWDAELRNKFNVWMSCAAAALFLILFGLGIFGGISLERFLSKVIAPFLPMLLFSARQVMQNNKTIATLNRLQREASSAFDNAATDSVTASELDQIARSLQDSLFFHRKNSPLIFDRFYNWYRDINQKSMSVSCEELVTQYLQAHP